MCNPAQSGAGRAFFKACQLIVILDVFRGPKTHAGVMKLDMGRTRWYFNNGRKRTWNTIDLQLFDHDSGCQGC